MTMTTTTRKPSSRRAANRISATVSIAVESAVLHPALPRAEFEPEELKSLADSMARDELLQRPIVRQLDNGRFEFLSGARRLRAAELLGWDEIPVTLRDYNDVEAVRVIGSEQLLHEDWDAIEQARYLKTLCTPPDDGGAGLTHAQAGEMFGKHQAWASDHIGLLTLPESIQKLVIDGSMARTTARLLVPHVDNPQVLGALLKDMERKPWAWQTRESAGRSVEAVLASLKEQPTRPATKRPGTEGRFSRQKVETFLRPFASNTRYLQTVIEVAQAMLAATPAK